MDELYRITRSDPPHHGGYYDKNGSTICNKYRAKMIVAAIKYRNKERRMWHEVRHTATPKVETFTVERAPVGEFVDVTSEFA